jgi:transcriptional regulator with XRE-family HTH domain
MNMSKYGRLVRRAVESVDYWTQAAMRRFVLDINSRMSAQYISRVELAKKLGTSPAYITKALRGDVNFTLETMTKLALAVGGKLHIEVVNREMSPRWRQMEWHFERRHEQVAPGQTMRLELDLDNIAANEPKCDKQKMSERAA